MKTNSIYIVLISCLFLSQINAQENYFQQKVDYRIECELDDINHRLASKMDISYTNNSPDELSFIYFHIWPNAYKNNETALSKQFVDRGEDKLYFAEDEDLGYIENLDFKLDGKSLEWKYDPMHQDIVIVSLNEALKPGKTIELKIPFDLKIPASFSRLGHVETSYQMTQWYPKPAVYDHKGWHPMPYLNSGEFYSEFGNFEVQITLPKNYLVAATGTLQEADEKAWLLEEIEKSNKILEAGTDDISEDFPASAKKMKTISFKAKDVHDFAWFADKRFLVQKGSVTLSNNDEIDTWAFFTGHEADLWVRAVEYLNNSVAFLSETVGNYPWPHATAVQSALSAGGGMEYPMITVIASSGNAESLDQVIEHEVGHNWFYGILAFNERDHAWMDEGINSYYEQRYMVKYYQKEMPDMLPDFIMSRTNLGLTELAYLLQSRRAKEQIANTSSNDLSEINYFLAAYMKPALVFKHLESYWGTAKFDKYMQAFYEAWKFKHPYPEDLSSFLENISGENLDWVFKDLLNSTKKIDYSIKRAHVESDNIGLDVVNLGEIAAPLCIAAYKDEVLQFTKWYDGFTGKRHLDFPKGDYDNYIIDPEFKTLEYNRKNNNLKSKAVFKTGDPIKMSFLTGSEMSDKQNIYYLPLLSVNNYDKLMLGLSLHNYGVPQTAFRFALNPMFGFGSNQLVGMGDLQLDIPLQGTVRMISLGLGTKRFSYNYSQVYDFHDHFVKLAPRLEIKFKKKDAVRSPSQKILIRSVNIFQDYGVGINIDTREFERQQRNYFVNQLNYNIKKKTALSKYEGNVSFEQGRGFTKFFGSFKQSYVLNKKGGGFSWRFFGGTMLSLDKTKLELSPFFRVNGIPGTGNIQRDYLYDEYLLGRSDTRDFSSQQIFDRDGYLKTLANVGSSESWMLGIGLKGSIRKRIPIRPYIDFVIYPDTFSENINLVYSGGLSLSLIKNVFEVNFPLLESQLLRDSPIYQTDRTSYFSKVSFLINLRQADPLRLLDEVEGF